MNFYTNIHPHKGKLLVRAIENGKRVRFSLPYRPYMFVPSKTGNSPYKTLQGKSVDKLDFANMYETRDFCKRYEDVDNFKIYGMSQPIYTYIYDEYPGDIDYDPEKIHVAYIDIEVASDDGFPNPSFAEKQITAITIYSNGHYFAFGCGDYKPTAENIHYLKCKDETTLLEKFLLAWEHLAPDVVTGWNVEFFDIPYIYNRICKILGETPAKKLSPWGVIDKREVERFGHVEESIRIAGIAILDYLQLYKKYSYTPQASYRLNHIAHEELGEEKLDYAEYDSLAELYKKNFQKFMEYNVRDVYLVKAIDDKRKFIEQIYALAYDAKVNFIDTFSPVRMWDVMIHNYLLAQNIVIPQQVNQQRGKSIVGGFVKETLTGMHKWVVGFDLTSLYPMLFQQYNISPETFRGYYKDAEVTVDSLLDGQLDDGNLQKFLKDNNYSLAATGCVFDRDIQGFLPALMARLFEQRAEYKKKMKATQKKLEKAVPGTDEHKALTREVGLLHNRQLIKKIQLNSGYGAFANPYFRWYDNRFAESITKSGQLSIRWMYREMNRYMNNKCETKDVDYIIACDTDSMYITMDKWVAQMGDQTDIVSTLDELCEKTLQPFIDKTFRTLSLKVNAFKHTLDMKRETISDKGIWTGKKHYILNVYDQEGVRYTKPKLKMVGIETIKSSTPAVCRKALTESLDIIMNKDEETLQKFIAELEKNYPSFAFEDIAFPRGCNNLDKYSDACNIYGKKTPIQVRGALVYNHYLDTKGYKKLERVLEGEKVKFSYLTMPNPIQSDVVSVPSMLPPQIGLHKYIDYNTQFNKGFLEPVNSILKVIGWNPRKVNTLDSFFK